MVQKDEYELNLLALFQTLWNKKYTLLFITFISFVFGIYYSNSLPISFHVNTPIKRGDQSLFIKYNAINGVLKESQSKLTEEGLDGYSVDAKSIFQKFIIEFKDYDEMIIALKKSEFVIELIKDLNKDAQKDTLISLAKSFKISEKKK